MKNTSAYLSFGNITFLAVLLRIFWAVLTPDWQSPDEYPHFRVIKELSVTGAYPISKREFPFYEGYQPPLYYFLSSFIYSSFKAFDSTPDINEEESILSQNYPINFALLAIRMFSVVLSALTLLVAIKFFKRLFETDKLSGLYAYSFFAFLPSFVQNGSSITNDALANLFGMLTLYLIVAGSTWKSCILFSLTFSAGMLTKTSIAPLFAVFFLSLILNSHHYKNIVAKGTLTILMILMLTGGWAIWNFSRYGSILPINPGLESNLPWVGHTISDIVHALFTYNWSFWGAAGIYYQIHYPTVIYLIFFLPVSVLSLSGVIKGAIVKVKGCNLHDFILMNKSGVILAGSVLIEFGAALYYTLMYPVNCAWGKFLFPVLAAIVTLFFYGLKEAVPKRFYNIFLLFFIITLISGNIYLLIKLVM